MIRRQIDAGHAGAAVLLYRQPQQSQRLLQLAHIAQSSRVCPPKLFCPLHPTSTRQRTNPAPAFPGGIGVPIFAPRAERRRHCKSEGEEHGEAMSPSSRKPRHVTPANWGLVALTAVS
jgi:hypothetical protein